jgi:hypothetical protein
MARKVARSVGGDTEKRFAAEEGRKGGALFGLSSEPDREYE